MDAIGVKLASLFPFYAPVTRTLYTHTSATGMNILTLGLNILK